MAFGERHLFGPLSFDVRGPERIAIRGANGSGHLDLASIEELENALKGFDGALIVVSHDEAFLRAIGIGREIALG
jgi:ATPase subunit of ABC transporter with duplicated ATPase domains